MNWRRAKQRMTGLSRDLSRQMSVMRSRAVCSAAQRAILGRRPSRARVVLELAIQILGLHIDGARPIFGSISDVDQFVEQLFVPTNRIRFQ